MKWPPFRVVPWMVSRMRSRITRRKRRQRLNPVRDPRVGEMWDVNFSPNVGHEQGGIRPALVISSDQFDNVPIVSASWCRLPALIVGFASM